MTIFRTLIIVLFVTSSSYAQGVVMVLNQTSGGKTSQSRIQLDRTHVRAEIQNQAQQMVVTYDSGAKVIRMIDPLKRTYTEITEQEIRQMGTMMAQMKEQMKNLPPEVQKQMAARMPSAGATSARITYKPTGSSKVGQWACTTYDGFRGAEKVAEVCAAERGLDLNPADFQVVQQLGDMMKSIAPQMEQIATFGTVESQGFAGFPVRNVTFLNGKPELTVELTELHREAIPASAFVVPDGFKKQSMGMGR